MRKHFAAESEKARFETFIDAILAIIVTILVLDFKVPEQTFASDDEIRSFLHRLLPALFSYTISFATIVSLWINHHDLCRKIAYADIRFVLLNFLFILTLSPIPFTTALAGRNHHSSFAVMLVASNYFFMNLAFSFIWTYVTAKKIIPESVSNSKPAKRNAIISIIGGILLLISIPLAYVNTYITFSIFCIVLTLHFAKEFFY
ncbi:MAG TPA: TMEM175 family protein [Parafilimonas sp.]|nr:TMEM175 family protein [Parafilimonas sp.]